MKPTYKIVTVKDMDCLIDLMCAYYEHDKIHFTEQKTRQNVLEIIHSEKKGVILLIQQKRTPIGYIAVTFGFGLEHGNNGTIDEFFILPDFRGQGLGKETLNHIESMLIKKGITAIHTEVETKNKLANEFWNQNGYQSFNRKPYTKMIGTLNKKTTPDRSTGG